MKSILYSLLVVLLVVFSNSCKKAAEPEAVIDVTKNAGAVDLNGTWSATGYQCPNGTFHQEEVKITHTGNTLSAIKTIGDPCVPAGKTTFTGTFNTAKNYYDVKFTTGSAASPASGQANGTLTVTSKNQLEAPSSTGEKIVYTRK
jgi:hypothetical protein